MNATLATIYRYPVKGLAGQALERTTLAPDEGIRHDRRYALAHASSRFDPASPGWLPKQNFLMLMRDERLAMLGIDYDDAEERLVILRNQKPVARGQLSTQMGRVLIEQFLAGFLPPGPRGNPKVVYAPGHMFSDNPDKVVSLINLATVKDLERVVRAAVDPRRFRGNFYVDGLTAWAENDWIGRTLRLGAVRLEVDRAIPRCAATNVDPDSAARDLNIPLALSRGYGHVNLGVYARVVTGGEIATGDVLVAQG